MNRTPDYDPYNMGLCPEAYALDTLNRVFDLHQLLVLLHVGKERLAIAEAYEKTMAIDVQYEVDIAESQPDADRLAAEMHDRDRQQRIQELADRHGIDETVVDVRVLGLIAFMLVSNDNEAQEQDQAPEAYLEVEATREELDYDIQKIFESSYDFELDWLNQERDILRFNTYTLSGEMESVYIVAHNNTYSVLNLEDYATKEQLVKGIASKMYVGLELSGEEHMHFMIALNEKLTEVKLYLEGKVSMHSASE